MEGSVIMEGRSVGIVLWVSFCGCARQRCFRTRDALGLRMFLKLRISSRDSVRSCRRNTECCVSTPERDSVCQAGWRVGSTEEDERRRGAVGCARARGQGRGREGRYLHADRALAL
jgi:hypothetical protein